MIVKHRKNTAPTIRSFSFLQHRQTFLRICSVKDEHRAILKRVGTFSSKSVWGSNNISNGNCLVSESILSYICCLLSATHTGKGLKYSKFKYQNVFYIHNFHPQTRSSHLNYSRSQFAEVLHSPSCPKLI